ncbi:MAG TPA: transglycosylase SLT domain-containing protein [Gemmatimonadales bacterium]|nr:transglycosylase SLT domain-containing protein [Gemmatimonadales bacterium]
MKKPTALRSSVSVAAAAALLVVLGCRPSPALPLSADSALAHPGDSTVAAAGDALAQGRPWRASRMLAPALEDSTRRTPEALLLAATAASRWNGWDEVTRLLDGVTWKDSLFQGEARRLLAAAALGRGANEIALVHARAAVAAAARGAGRDAPAGEMLGERLVLEARAFEGLGQRDSAAAAWARAAELLPEATDWLRLRAAGATDDAGRRGALLAQVALPAAQARIGWTDAKAREQAKDYAGAERAYLALPDAQASALRMALAGAGADTAARASVRWRLAAMVRERPGTGDARVATQLLDSAFAPLTPAEELLIARSAAQGGPLARAATAFERALDAGLAKVPERYTYAGVLFRLGRYADAAKQYARIPATDTLAPAAAYARARAFVRAGQTADGLTALRAIDTTFPGDTESASIALYLRADLATDAQDEAGARALLLELVRRYPSSRQAQLALFRAAVIGYAAGDTTAAREFDSVATRWGSGGEALAGRYWYGRARFAQGDTAAARAAWREVLNRDPLSYYAAASARRLGLAPWTPAAAPDTFATVPALDSAMARAALLERLGLDAEARLEYAAAARAAQQDTTAGAAERLLATADRFRERGLASQGIQLARRALERGAPRDARTYRLIYPVVRQEALIADAADQGLDPVFVAALIRQESLFDPAATSGAGARGLMQLMPEVGRGLARAAGFPLWDPVLLYQPDVSLELGTRHLRELAGRYAEPAYILAAYNAGATRVERWKTRQGVEDPELFAERIPYVETRDYVRIIARNRDLYGALYQWPEVRTAGR